MNVCPQASLIPPSPLEVAPAIWLLQLGRIFLSVCHLTVTSCCLAELCSSKHWSLGSLENGSERKVMYIPRKSKWIANFPKTLRFGEFLESWIILSRPATNWLVLKTGHMSFVQGIYLGGGFIYFLMFTPPIWGRFPIRRAYFSDGLKPTTRYCSCFRISARKPPEMVLKPGT